MLVRSRNVDVLDQLNDRVRRVRAVSADLMLDLIEATSALLPELNGTRKAAVVHRLVKCRAWTDAALALLEIELPQWKLRRLVFEDGKWLCSLSRQINMPPALDDGVEATHSVMPLAILGALLEAKRQASIKLAFEEMLTDPFSGDVKPLAGAEGHLRRRIGDWRIFFELLPEQRLIVVKSVQRRGSKTY